MEIATIKIVHYRQSKRRPGGGPCLVCGRPSGPRRAARSRHRARSSSRSSHPARPRISRAWGATGSSAHDTDRAPSLPSGSAIRTCRVWSPPRHPTSTAPRHNGAHGRVWGWVETQSITRQFSTGLRMLDSGSSRSANRSAPKILCCPASAQKSPINTGLCAETSALRGAGRARKFALSGPLSPKLWTAWI